MRTARAGPSRKSMTDAERTSRWSRRFVIAGATFLVAWQVAALAGDRPHATLVLGVMGFVLHTVFGKAYSLLPTYFDRDLATTRFLPVHFGLVVTGTVLLALDREFARFDFELAGLDLGLLGRLAWTGGVAVFLGTIFWTIRDNPTGAETATSETKAHRKRVDRVANFFVPVALLYLAVGSWELLAAGSGLPGILDGYRPRTTHLLAAGTASLLVFAVGFRLLPRFLVASPPLSLVLVVLPSGAIAPALLAAQLPSGRMFKVGALLQAIAIACFALAFWLLYYRSDRRRVGFYGVLACTVAGLLGVGLGLYFAFEGINSALLEAHRRSNVLGFLGLAIVGISYQFYPPAVGTLPGIGDRTALGVIATFFAGLVLEVAGALAGVDAVGTAARVLVLGGALVHCYLLAGLFHERYG